MNNVEEIYQTSADVAAFADRYFKYLHTVLSRIDTRAIAQFVAVLADARESGNTVFFIGNGGSAATASHFANDLAIGTRSSSKPFRVVSLTDNNAVMTCIANDFGYDQVFVRQLQALFRPNDVLVAISVSGNSANVIKAVEFARNNGGRVVTLTGFDGGALQQLGEVNVHVPTEPGEYGPAEDAHMVLDHLVGAYLMLRCRQEAVS